MVDFFVKSNEYIYPNGKALMQTYTVGLYRKEGIY